MPPAGAVTESPTLLHVTSDCPVGFGPLRERNRRSLLDALDEWEGAKGLVWDPFLMKAFDSVASSTELRGHAVTQMFGLQKGPAPAVPSAQHLFFIVRPTISNAEVVADNLRSIRKEDKRQVQYHLLFVPRSSVICEQKLRDLEVDQKLTTVQDLPIGLFVLDEGLVSMESSLILERGFLHDDWSALYDVVVAIDQLEKVYGQVSRFCYKGDWSERIFKLLQKKREQDAIAMGKGASELAQKAPLIHTVLLLDRWADPVTPLVTQLTYEGLIDEIFGIRCGSTSLPKEHFTSEEHSTSSSGATGQDANKKIVLTSADDLYAELRNLNFNAVGPRLRTRIKAISEKIEQRHSATTVREYKEFVKRLPELQAARQSAGTQTSIAELIKQTTTSETFLETVQCEQEILNCLDVDRMIPYIEEAICKAVPMSQVLRLVCLQSLACDGLKQKVFDGYRKALLQSYGYKCLGALVCLQKSGLLLRERGAGGARALPFSYPAMFRHGELMSFASLRKAFRLIVDDVNEQNPNDAAYVYSGFAPLSVRLCQYLMKPGWKAIMDTLKRVPGAVGIEDTPGFGDEGNAKKVILVVFVGGVTFAELAALRFLNSEQSEYFIVVATTHVTTGTRLINTFLNDD